LEGQFDDLPDLPRFAAKLGAARSKAFALTQHLDSDIARLPPMDAVRALVARIEDGEGLADAIALTAAPGALLPAVLRAREGLSPIAADPAASHAVDMLRMLTDRAPTPELARALDTYLVTICDHGFNASTFAARVVASTWAGLTSSVLAGFSALKGPLHGGAP